MQVFTSDCHALLAGDLINPVTRSGCDNQVTGMKSDFQSSGATCKGYTSADPADRMVVGWSCSDNSQGLVYNWIYPKGTQSCDLQKQFLCVTTPDLQVQENCYLTAAVSDKR